MDVSGVAKLEISSVIHTHAYLDPDIIYGREKARKASAKGIVDLYAAHTNPRPRIVGSRSAT
jgi:hypothetical protein